MKGNNDHWEEPIISPKPEQVPLTGAEKVLNFVMLLICLACICFLMNNIIHNTD